MRYEDWDVLLFPRDCSVPFKEFNVTCQVVHDAEFAHIHGFSGLPTVTCYVPSLTPGAPFHISIHSWNTPTISQLTRSYSKHVNDVKFETRLFIDGRLVASTSLNRQCDWPHVIANSFDFSKNGDLEPLKFPVFQQEILQQRRWNAGDDLGRIRLIISEGFPRDSLTLPMERVKNIVAFSFQHAPQEILEHQKIAWPNASMWQRSQYATSMPVPSFPSNNVKSHAHSPRRRQQRVLAGFTTPMAQSVMSNVTTTHVEEPTQASYIGPLPNTNEIPGCNDLVDSFDHANPYFDWPDNVEFGLDTISPQLASVVSKSGHNWEASGESSMSERPGPARDASGSTSEDTQFTSLAFSTDDEFPKAQPKAPAKASTVVEHVQPVPFPIFPHNSALPEDLALSLTASLLSQPMPMQSHAPPTRTSTPEVRSRKENRKRHSTCPVPSTLSVSTPAGLDHRDQRKVSQQMYIPPSGSFPVPLAQPQPQSPRTSQPDLARRTGSMGKLVSAETPSTQSSPREFPNTADKEKGNKRSRTFTPGSARPSKDDEDKHRRASPRMRLSPFSEGQPNVGV